MYVGLSEVIEFLGSCVYKAKVQILSPIIDFKGSSKKDLNEVIKSVFAKQSAKGKKVEEMKTFEEEDNPQEIELYNTLEESMLEFLSSLIEGCFQADLFEKLKQFIDTDILISNMHEHYLQKEQGTDEDKKKQLDLTYSYYVFAKSIADALSPQNAVQKKLELWISKNKVQIEDFSVRIEILDAQGKIKVMYFQKPELVRMYWDNQYVQETKKVGIPLIDRSNPESKISQLDQLNEKLISVIDHQDRLYKRFTKPSVFTVITGPLYYIIIRNRKLQSLVLNLLAIIMNFIYLMFITKDTMEATIDQNIFLGMIRGILGLVHLIFCIFFLLNQIIVSTACDIIDLKKQLDEKKQKWFKKFSQYFWEILKWDLLYKATLLIMSLLGYFVSPSFYSMTLIIIICESKIMQEVLKSIFIPLDKVIATCLMTFIMLYWFASWTFFGGKSGTYQFPGPMNCDSSLFNCTATHINFGWINSPEFEEDLDFENFFFNLTYVLLINLITTAIISGIIIDTFGEMRSTREEIEKDDYNNCFVCCLPKDNFEKYNIDFDNHRNSTHNVDFYCWLRYHLVKKPSSAMNGIESYIFELIQKKKTSYFPIEKSAEIEKKEGEEAAELEGMDKITQLIKGINENIDELKKEEKEEE